MAKDGTARGGARIGAGKKKKPLADKIAEGKAPRCEVLTIRHESENSEMSPPKKYLSAKQKDGGKLHAKLIYKETWQWLKAHGCESLVPKQLIENYAMVSARHIYCEEQLNKNGMLAPHPTTGEPMTSPFVKMSLDYMKQASQLWYQIFQVVKENCANGYEGANPQNDLMESLLRQVKR